MSQRGKPITFSELSGGGRILETADYEKIGKVPDESVFKHTGKHWKDWIVILERAGAHAWSYSEIAAYLKTKHRLTPWWQQGVALGFEIASGRRKVGQDAKGKYMVTATKSLGLPAGKVWAYLMSSAGIAIWLKPFSRLEILPKVQFETEDGFFGEVRTVVKNRRARLFWQDPLWEKHTVVELMLVPRPGGKSLLVFNHTGIHDVKGKETLRKRWRGVADQIAEELR